MRHRVIGRKLARTGAHRLALRRNLVQSLIEHGELRTTLVRAKEVRRMAERLVQLAVEAADRLGAAKSEVETKAAKLRALHLRRRAAALLNDRAIIRKENREKYDRMTDAERALVLRSKSGRRYRVATTRPWTEFTAESVIHKLFAEVGPRMAERNRRVAERNGGRAGGGGYTRIIKLAERRLGDAGPVALLQFVGPDDKPREKNGDKGTKRQRRIQRKYAFYAGKTPPRRGPRRGAKAEAKPAAQSAGQANPATPEGKSE